MNIKWKALFAALVIVATFFWAASALRTRSYNGANLTFEAGSGTITITNPSSISIPARFTGRQSATFTVSSNIEGVGGRSAREGTGTGSAQVYEFRLPPGTSEFNLGRSNGVSFAAVTDTPLDASMQPMDASTSRTTLIAAIVLIVAALYYISSQFDHNWISMLPGRDNLLKPVPAAVGEQPGQGKAAKAYGDNRLR